MLDCDNSDSASDESSYLHGPPPVAVLDLGLSQDFPGKISTYSQRPTEKRGSNKQVACQVAEHGTRENLNLKP